MKFAATALLLGSFALSGLHAGGLLSTPAMGRQSSGDAAAADAFNLTVTHIGAHPVQPKETSRYTSGGSTVWCGDRITVKPGTVYKISSPGYPGSYGSYENCKRTFTIPANTALSFDCSTFDLPCYSSGYGARGDLFTLKLGYSSYLYCNNALQNGKISGFPVQSSSYSFDINFESNGYSTGDGFTCNMMGVDTSDTNKPTATTQAPATTAAPTSGGSSGSSSSCDCGRSSSTVAADLERIVGGGEAPRNYYPWQVGLVPCERCIIPSCGGTIISKDYILTAAHCTQDPDPYWVLVGEHDTRYHQDDAYRVRATKRNHWGYNSKSMANDFALLQLDDPLTFSDTVRPACLPSNPNELYTGEYATVSGWGLLYDGGNQPDKLHDVTIKIVSNEECEQSYGSGSIGDEKMCASARGKDSCQGDSGGPLVVGDTLVGVVSYGIGCADPNFPGVYARVTTVLSSFLKYTGMCQK